MKNFLVGVIFSGLIVLLTGSVWAHSNEGSSAVKGAHGGQLLAAGPYHFELLAKDGELRLYITDHNNNEVLAKGGSAKANIFDKDGKKVSVQLVPIFSNFMKGTGDFKITPETVVSVFVVVQNNKTNVARFTSLVQGSSPADVKEETHEHHHEDAESNESASNNDHDEHESSAEQGESDTDEED
ncbi:hypothetical protein ABO04_09385 [Nitrosomonas sp. HPC101]|uniref:hypothetical protein n=1 Tax=Nitrosomonas sp. HPC101 TaxID=1658667 RepID=UPI00136D4E54|nr:hypothetical protein [Nitrosomonas sp. HPC101]MXS86104.1 hypothetical protein [Nitrosomonas sp. HPC101]